MDFFSVLTLNREHQSLRQIGGDPTTGDTRREVPSLLKRLVVHLAILMVTAFILYGCVTAEQGNRIVPDDVKWIEIERTTRAEVVARYGLPPLEFPQRPTRLRKATYVYCVVTRSFSRSMTTYNPHNASFGLSTMKRASFRIMDSWVIHATTANCRTGVCILLTQIDFCLEAHVAEEENPS